MTYDPSRTPIRELILQDIEDTLAAVDGSPSYANTLKCVRRWNGNVTIDTPTHPCAIVVPLNESMDDGYCIGMISNVMNVGIVIGTRGMDWPSRINTIIDDTRVALTADPSRGGIAVTTRIKEVSVFDADPTETVGSAQMLVEILYRTRYDDPTTAI